MPLFLAPFTRIPRQPLTTLAVARQLAIGHHVITGVSGEDLDVRGYLEPPDPDRGAVQWRWYVGPQLPGDPGLESWPSLEAARHGGGMTWQPVTYDPELNLLF